MGINRQLARVFIFVLILFPQFSYGWGQDGHRIVAYVGSQLAGKGSLFWKANSKSLVMLTSVPDMSWRIGEKGEMEAPTHFFQPDSYFKDPHQFGKIPQDFALAVKMVGKQRAIEFGTASWRVGQFYDLALQALKKKDFKTAIEMAGVMSHYIGDLSQPLHVTENYDGQKTKNPGIHKFFETTNIKPHATELIKPVGTTSQALLKNPNFLKYFKGSVTDAVFNEAFRAYSFQHLVIETDLKLGRKDEGSAAQLQIARARLADGAATFAMVLTRLWNESGLNDAGTTVQVNIPQWVKPFYYDTNAQLLEQIEGKTRKLLLGDDCEL